MPREKSTHLAYRHLSFSPLNAHVRFIDPEKGIVQLDPERKKVVIYGAGVGAMLAERKIDDPSWEAWGLNVIPPMNDEGELRCDRWFEMHQRCAQSYDDMEWIARCPVPMYVPADLMGYGPQTVRYPIEAIEAKYGNYWACTFAYQIALAMFEGFTDIGMYGVELCYGTLRERTVEWACVMHWMGRAEQAGITFHLPPGSRLGRHPYRYGLEYHEEINEVKRYIRRQKWDPGWAWDGRRLAEDESVGG